MKRPTGIHRTKRPLGVEDDVWVDDSGMRYDIPESRYRANRYEPPIESLPWRAAEDGE